MAGNTLMEQSGWLWHSLPWVTNKNLGIIFIINPINHGKTKDEINIYKVEPYVVAADVYALHLMPAEGVGRGIRVQQAGCIS